MSGPLIVKPQAEWGRLHAAAIRGLNTGGAASIEIRSGAVQVFLRELFVLVNGASSTRQGLGRPAAIGVTPNSPTPFQPYDPDEQPSLSTLAVSWATPPTAPTNYLRQWSPLINTGDGNLFTFGPGELVIPANSSLVIWNLNFIGTAPEYSVTIQE